MGLPQFMLSNFKLVKLFFINENERKEFKYFLLKIMSLLIVVRLISEECSSVAK